jgi:uncharacterized protein (DUF433 family)
VTTRQTGYQYIERIPGVVGGEPVIRGTRIPVRTVILYYRVYGDLDQVNAAYPHVTRDALEDALAYYASHQDEIDRYIAENDDEA